MAKRQRKNPASGTGKSAASAKSGGKRKQTVASIVATKLRDNFCSFGPDETDVIQDPSTTLTLRQRLEKDVQSHFNGDHVVVWGPLYYGNLKTIYSCSQSVRRRLAPSNPELEVDPALVKARKPTWNYASL